MIFFTESFLGHFEDNHRYLTIFNTNFKRKISVSNEFYKKILTVFKHFFKNDNKNTNEE